MNTMEISINQLTLDHKIQLKARGIDNATVASYVEAINSEAELGPITVFFDGSTYWVADGFHRTSAHRFLGRDTIKAEVRQGSYNEALVYAATANVTNGRPMGQAEKREAGERLIKLTNWSDYEIGRRLAVDQKTVWNWREKSSKENSLDTRTVTRNGTTYQMNTNGIGKPVTYEQTTPMPEMRLIDTRPLYADDPHLDAALEDETKPVCLECGQVYDGASCPDCHGYSLGNNRPHVANNSGDNEWYTPPEFTKAALSVMGSIDLDPASSEVANEVVGASIYYSSDDNGLDKIWTGNVWMNPPYARDLIQKFADKLITHYLSGEITQAITLTNNSTETVWFQNMAEYASAVCLPKGRVQFWHPEKESATPLQGQAILYFGNNQPEFCNHFRKFGTVWVKHFQNC